MYCIKDHYYINKVKLLDEFQKLEVYMHYYCTMLYLKYNFTIVDKIKPNWQLGWGMPDKEYLNIAFYYLRPDIFILDFDDFISEQNIKIIDCGEDWEQRHRAQRWRIETSGIYNWYCKHENVFRFI
jgi:hypothetical protein